MSLSLVPINDAMPWKYSEAQKLLVVNMIGRFMMPQEIIDECKTVYGMKVSVDQINVYKHGKKWQKIIADAKQKYLSNLAEVPGTHKRVRMDRRERLYAKAYKRSDLKNGLQAVRDQQDEIEGKGQHNTVTFNQVNLMSNEELEARRRELLLELKKEEKGESNGPSRTTS